MTVYKKERLCVMQARSLRELVDAVNSYNTSNASKILKDDIVELQRDADGSSWFLLYYN